LKACLAGGNVFRSRWQGRRDHRGACRTAGRSELRAARLSGPDVTVDRTAALRPGSRARGLRGHGSARAVEARTAAWLNTYRPTDECWETLFRELLGGPLAQGVSFRSYSHAVTRDGMTSRPGKRRPRPSRNRHCRLLACASLHRPNLISRWPRTLPLGYEHMKVARDCRPANGRSSFLTPIAIRLPSRFSRGSCGVCPLGVCCRVQDSRTNRIETMSREPAMQSESNPARRLTPHIREDHRHGARHDRLVPLRRVLGASEQIKRRPDGFWPDRAFSTWPPSRLSRMFRVAAVCDVHKGRVQQAAEMGGRPIQLGTETSGNCSRTRTWTRSYVATPDPLARAHDHDGMCPPGRTSMSRSR